MDDAGYGSSRLTGNDQVQAFPRRDTVQTHHQSISIDRAPTTTTRNEGGNKPPPRAGTKERKKKLVREHAFPSSKQTTSAKDIPDYPSTPNAATRNEDGDSQPSLKIKGKKGKAEREKPNTLPSKQSTSARPSRRNVPAAESANPLPAGTHQTHRASTSTAQLPSTSETLTPQSDNSQLPKPRPKNQFSGLKFKKNIPQEPPKLVLKEEENNLAQLQENRPEAELALFQEPLVPPSSIVVLLPSVATARGVTMAPTQPVHSTLATITPTAAISADEPEKPSRKRKKNQTSNGEAAEEGGKPVKKPRKKKGESVENRTERGFIEGGSGQGSASVGLSLGRGAEKQPRKKKKKVDGDVISALESGMVQLNVQDAASRNAEVERTSTVVAHAESEKNVGAQVAMAEERGKVEEKKTSGRGRKRKKPGDEGGSGSSQKKKKVKLEDEEMGGDEGGNDEMDDPISGNNAITGEWARKRTRSSKSNVKWTVFSGPTTDENFITASRKPTKASKSKRVASASVETTVTPERILRPNIWAAVRFLHSPYQNN